MRDNRWNWDSTRYRMPLGGLEGAKEKSKTQFPCRGPPAEENGHPAPMKLGTSCNIMQYVKIFPELPLGTRWEEKL